jgi:hypothetical protein
MVNWYFGWGLILCAFVTGAIIGMFFYRDDFLGGYSSFRRRILRLGHIALVGLGMINILFSLTASAEGTLPKATAASIGFIVGGVTMPGVCFLSAWRAGFRRLFFIPVAALIIAAIQPLRIGFP